jgi:CRP/FNR family transcriptional regulator, anaerobic regulatory protein
MEPAWLERFSALADLDEHARQLLERRASVAVIPPGSRVFEPGAECGGYLMVVAGTVRVQMLSSSGREIVLYRVGAGETCIMTTSCLMSGHTYMAQGITETRVEAVVIPAPDFETLVAESSRFRHFAFTSFGTRLVDLMLLVEEVAFQRIDLRMAQLLVQRCGGGGKLSLTHQEVAVELGTAREVVSRQLKEFERRGWVALHRGWVDVRDAAALGRLAAERAM